MMFEPLGFVVNRVFRRIAKLSTKKVRADDDDARCARRLRVLCRSSARRNKACARRAIRFSIRLSIRETAGRTDHKHFRQSFVPASDFPTALRSDKLQIAFK
jgi:hypothetical protein